MTATDKYESLLELCKARHSCRAFSSSPVAREDIDKVLNLAAASPYASGTKSWEIMVVSDLEKIKAMALAVRKRCAELGERSRDDFRKEFLDYSRFFTSFETAPVLLIPAFRDRRSLSLELPGQGLESFERENSVKSISCVSMLVLLAAESLGLGACYMTGPLLAAEELGKLAGLRPGREPGALIPLGYKEQNNG